MSYNKLVNGEVVPMTQEEITARQAEEAAWMSDKITAHISAYRYQRENGGITINGVPVQTDQAARANLLGAKELGIGIKWKTPAGFVDLTAQQVADIATAVGLHIQKCFAAEAAITGQTFTTTAQVEAAFDAAYSA